MKKRFFSSKANVLKFLSNRIKQAKIEKIYDITISDWRQNQKQILKEILLEFSPTQVIIRSSAVGEDSEITSQAGNYLTIQNVDSTSVSKLKRAIEQVIRSYQEKGNTDYRNQVLIQSQTKNVVTSGVIFSRTCDNGAPYFVINYQDGFSTDGVTKGQVGNTVKIFRRIKKEKILNKWSELINSVFEIEKKLETDFLDIEFGITPTKIVIFQVRPITSIKNKPEKRLERKISSLIKNNQKKFEKLNVLQKRFGNYLVFSDMSDWNPAEIIGNNPNLLDYSLYDFLIMKKNWCAGRNVLGYQNIAPISLMIKFGNKPYVDVGRSFNSLIPSDVPDKLKRKLVNFYIKKLMKNLHLHDKIEFEIILSCYDFSTKSKMLELRNHGFSVKETKILEKILKNLTNNIFDNFPHFDRESLIAIKRMNDNREKILEKLNSSNRNCNDILSSLHLLLKDCQKFGAYYFSMMARIAFIGSIILKSLVNEGHVKPVFFDSFMNSISSPLSEIQEDLELLRKKDLSKKEFLKKYGHLRPGTYDITATRYDKDQRFLENMKYLKAAKYSENLTKPINKILFSHGLKLSEKEFFHFVSESLTLREKLKFEFTRNLSDSLELIAEVGEQLTLTREQMAHLEITTIIKSRNMSKNNLKKIFQNQIVINAKKKSINDYQILPSIIHSIRDFEIIENTLAKPNFITRKKILGKVVKLNRLEKQFPDLENAIIAIENADPGYDWIFANNLAGLITRYGGVASHMAIRCAELGLPAAIGCGESIFEKLTNRSKILLDCNNENLIIIQEEANDPYFREKQILKSLGYIR